MDKLQEDIASAIAARVHWTDTDVRPGAGIADRLKCKAARADYVRPYLLTTPVQHYADQAKLAMFDEMRLLLHAALKLMPLGTRARAEWCMLAQDVQKRLQS